jgi:hypothetical protein
VVRDAGAKTLLRECCGKWLGTPEGWARANLLLKTLRAPPQQGTLRESVLTLMMMKLEAIEHARFRALAQITIDKDKGVEAFEEYMKIAFPYLEASKRQERKGHIEKLQKEVSLGPMAVRALPGPPRMRSRVSEAKAASRTTPRSAAEEQRLYKKIGRAI